MKIVATHPIGTEIHLEGSRRHIKKHFDEWWASCTLLLIQQPEEEREPQKNGAESMAQFAGARYFEQEASPYAGQDVPIVQAKQTIGFTLNTERRTA